ERRGRPREGRREPSAHAKPCQRRLLAPGQTEAEGGGEGAPAVGCAVAVAGGVAVAAADGEAGPPPPAARPAPAEQTAVPPRCSAGGGESAREQHEQDGRTRRTAAPSSFPSEVRHAGVRRAGLLARGSTSPGPFPPHRGSGL